MDAASLPADPSALPGRSFQREVFRYANRMVMIPLLRRGAGRFISNPLAGYFMLLQTTGRKSGQLRWTPLNYVIDQGDVVCLAGFGERADWLANVCHNPHVHVRLSGREINGHAVEVQDPAEASRLAVHVGRASGFALLFEDFRCLVMTDAQLAEQFAGRPVVRITPNGEPIIPGPYDPGGQGWIAPMVAQAVGLVTLWFLRHSKRKHL